MRFDQRGTAPAAAATLVAFTASWTDAADNVALDDRRLVLLEKW